MPKRTAPRSPSRKTSKRERAAPAPPAVPKAGGGAAGLLVGGTACLLLGLVAWLRTRPRPAAVTPVPSPRLPPRSELDEEALARMLASETKKRAAWPYMAAALRNVAAARHLSLAQLLRQVKGVDQGWGKNEEGHWAGTSQPATPDTRDFARRWLAGEIPDPPDAQGILSFYEVDEHGIQHDPAAFLARNPELVLAVPVEGWEFYRRRA